jgi:hypothetical protein
MARLLRGVGMARFLEEPLRLQLDRRLSTPLAIASCGTDISVLLWSAPSGTPWQFFVAISEVLAMMGKIMMVVPDDQWILISEQQPRETMFLVVPISEAKTLGLSFTGCI